MYSREQAQLRQDCDDRICAKEHELRLLEQKVSDLMGHFSELEQVEQLKAYIGRLEQELARMEQMVISVKAQWAEAELLKEQKLCDTD